MSLPRWEVTVTEPGLTSEAVPEGWEPFHGQETRDLLVIAGVKCCWEEVWMGAVAGSFGVKKAEGSEGEMRDIRAIVHPKLEYEGKKCLEMPSGVKKELSVPLSPS
jgi:hypothetical protein